MRRLRDVPDLVFAVLLVAWAVVLTRATLTPVLVPTPALFPHADKLMHGIGWFVLGALAGCLSPPGLARLLAFVLATTFGFFIEVGQIFVPTRHFEALDLLADAVGSALGVALARLRDGDDSRP